MDSAMKKYEYRKIAFQTALDKAEEELAIQPPNKDTLRMKMPIIQRCQERFLQGGELLLEAKQRNNEDVDALALLEVEIQDLYGKSEAIIYTTKEVLSKSAQPEEDSQNVSQNMHHLPKLELPKFGGEARDWLQFWSAFQSIHNDDSITASLKFQYLSNCMLKGSPAQELVSSYPMTPANYPKVIKSLKERFGREEMLVEVYVRDLITLILENAQNKTMVHFSSLYIKLSSQLRALGSLGVTTDKCAAILYPIVESALPEDIFLAWERHRHQNAADASGTSEEHLEKLMIFLKHEVEGSERIRLARQPFSASSTAIKKNYASKPQIATAANLVQTETKLTYECLFCEGKHPSEQCCKAMSKPLEERRKLVQEKHRCFACLQPGHGIKKCRESVKCISCGKRHYVVLCPEFKASKPTNKDNHKQEPVQSVQMCNQLENNNVLFQTVIVDIKGNKQSKQVRALFDTGSQTSYILKRTVDEIGLSRTGQKEVVHLLFGGVQTKLQLHNCYSVELTSLDSSFRCNFEVQDSPYICSNIPTVPNGNWINELKAKGIQIYDGNHCSNEIELLIGTDVYGKLITGEKLELDSGPVAIGTKLGWTISGKLREESNSSSTVLSYHVKDISIQDLWRLDLIGINEPMKEKTKGELAQAAKDHFLKTVRQKEDGRYVVRLPWIEGHKTVPNYRSIAYKRLEATTSRLKKQQVISAYHNVFSCWEGSGIIEKVPNATGHYLTHHGVLKPESETTPVRPVFNASFKTKGNVSLNDCLEVGPNMLEEIPAILLRFRMGPVGITADIEKAFLQIEVDSADRDYLRFLWYNNEELLKVQDYRHCRVVFGVSSSPFLLAAVINHLIENCSSSYKSIANVLNKSFYVDNLLTSLSSIEEALQFKEKSSALFSTAQMNLRCWEIGPSTVEKEVPVLGLTWNLKEDTLECDLRGVKKKMDDNSVTRRKILSVSHSMFDPIGFTCAFTIIPKMILQKCHKIKGGWDSELPEEFSKQFHMWCQQISEVPALRIPRCAVRNPDRTTWSINIFTDASQLAYAAVAFLRSGYPGEIQVELLMARSRVAPIKDTTIPRLELLACLCGARLCSKIKEILSYQDIPVFLHTDSTTALAWILKLEIWSVFVSARVEEIRRLSDVNDWYHVPGKHNPADIPSRGCSINHLIEIKWWEGPNWLKQEKEFWPKSIVTENVEEIDKERKKTVISHVNLEETSILGVLNRYSDYQKIVRIVGYVIRACKLFRRTHREKTDIQTGSQLSYDEMQLAEITILKIVQETYFTGVCDSKLKQLHVYQDASGILRMKTKLFAGVQDDFKCPVILPSKEPIIRKLIWSIHVRTCHVGVQSLMSLLRERYWILHCRRTVRSVLLECVKCLRYKSQPVKVIEGPLPSDRIFVGPAFSVTGVDMAGPLYTKGKRKVWIVIFTCATYRAIHLELCSNLTTEVFILAFRRFVARRGRPSVIYSDNGLNFVGCSNLLKKIDWEKITNVAKVQNIQWKFNPPTASWWGGFWERMIRIVKQMLKSVLGASRVTNEELHTLLCDIESVVNNRPLTYMDEQDDLVSLTPNSFINNCGTSFIPDVDSVERHLLVRRYQNMQHCRDELRNRFRKEYLSMLIHNGKVKKSRTMKVGDVVLVGCDNQKRLSWPMGIIIEVMPGKDGHIRVVKVKTSNGVLLRPVQRLYPLEINNSDNVSRSEI